MNVRTMTARTRTLCKEVASTLHERTKGRLDERTRDHLGVLRRVAVGDRTGATVFLLAIAFFFVTWQADLYINDNYTLANAMVAVADGHLHIERFAYEWRLKATPGMVTVDGRLYGRNYGQLFLSLPFLWFLSASATLLDPAWTLLLAWSGIVFALSRNLGASLGRPRTGTGVGAALALLLLSANAALVQPFGVRWIPWLSLEVSSLVAAALVAVFVYRLLARMYDRRIGGFAGGAVALASPLGFWATLPKRHSFAALFAVTALYCFYRSRAAPTLGKATRFRALAYVPVGLAVWVHAPEGFVLFLALGTVDVVTARSNSPGQLAVVAVTLGLAMVPFLVTNTVIAGNPFEPPRALPAYEPGTGAGSGVVDPGQSGTGGTVLGLLVAFAAHMARGFAAVLDGERLVDVFVRSGNELGIGQAILGGRSLNLSMLESMPLAAILLATPVVAYQRLRRRGSGALRDLADMGWLREGPMRATDALGVVYFVLLAMMYLPRLPIKVSFTVRYLFPMYPIGIYFVARLAPVRETVRSEWRLLGGSYAAFVGVGAPLLIAFMLTVPVELEVAVQYHARLALAAGAVVLYWGVVSILSDGFERGGALALAFAGSLTTLYVLLSGWAYFQHTEQFAVPLSRLVAERIILW